MRDHFKAEHFLCEEDDCIHEEFTAVFRTEIDLRAHFATVHSKTMTRYEARQARVLEIDISYGPRGRGAGGGGSGAGGGNENSRYRIKTNDTQREFDHLNCEPQIVQQPPIQIDTKNEQHFPSLAGPSTASHSGSSSVQLANSVRHIVYGTSGLARTKENFPALGANSNNKNQAEALSSLISSNNGGKPNSNSKKSSSGPTASSLFKASGNKSLQRPLSSSSSIGTSSNAAKTSGYKKDSISDFPSLPQNATKKGRDNSLLMEDLILPSNNNIDKNLVPSKHRMQVSNEYVSMATQMTKVNLIKHKDDAINENQQKVVPKLSSINNFPTLGVDSSESSSSSKQPQWMTIKSGNISNNTNQKQPKVENFIKKQNQVPQAKQNGMKKLNDVNKKTKKDDNNAIKSKDSGKEHQQVFSTNLSIKPTTAAPPPGFKQIETIAHFTPMPGANKRNQALVEELQNILKTNEAMQEFRLLSQMFRDGNYFARSYFESCKVVLGEKFNTIFPELLAMLPDIDRQQVG